MHLTDLIIELDLPQQLHVFGCSGGENFLIPLPSGAFGVVAIGEPIGCVGAGERGCQCDNESPHRNFVLHSGPAFTISSGRRGRQGFGGILARGEGLVFAKMEE